MNSLLNLELEESTLTQTVRPNSLNTRSSIKQKFYAFLQHPETILFRIQGPEGDSTGNAFIRVKKESSTNHHFPTHTTMSSVFQPAGSDEAMGFQTSYLFDSTNTPLTIVEGDLVFQRVEVESEDHFLKSEQTWIISKYCAVDDENTQLATRIYAALYYPETADSKKHIVIRCGEFDSSNEQTSQQDFWFDLDSEDRMSLRLMFYAESSGDLKFLCERNFVSLSNLEN